jgi:hypothetical protein
MPMDPEHVAISEDQVGLTSDVPPTFLERWGVVFLAIAGGWILVVGLVLLTYYLCNLPALPNTTGLAPDQIQSALATHKQLSDEWRDELVSIFDLLVTKTVLPIVTLLLGYLFGKSKTNA